MSDKNGVMPEPMSEDVINKMKLAIDTYEGICEEYKSYTYIEFVDRFEELEQEKKMPVQNLYQQLKTLGRHGVVKCGNYKTFMSMMIEVRKNYEPYDLSISKEENMQKKEIVEKFGGVFGEHVEVKPAFEYKDNLSKDDVKLMCGFLDNWKKLSAAGKLMTVSDFLEKDDASKADLYLISIILPSLKVFNETGIIPVYSNETINEITVRVQSRLASHFGVYS